MSSDLDLCSFAVEIKCMYIYRTKKHVILRMQIFLTLNLNVFMQSAIFLTNSCI